MELDVPMAAAFLQAWPLYLKFDVLGLKREVDAV